MEEDKGMRDTRRRLLRGLLRGLMRELGRGLASRCGVRCRLAARPRLTGAVPRRVPIDWPRTVRRARASGHHGHWRISCTITGTNDRFGEPQPARELQNYLPSPPGRIEAVLLHQQPAEQCGERVYTLYTPPRGICAVTPVRPPSVIAPGARAVRPSVAARRE